MPVHPDAGKAETVPAEKLIQVIRGLPSDVAKQMIDSASSSQVKDLIQRHGFVAHLDCPGGFPVSAPALETVFPHVPGRGPSMCPFSRLAIFSQNCPWGH
jgi:hypothetical protein